MKLRKKGLEDENATYLPSLEGDLAREELKARLGGLHVKELQQEASAMVVGMEKVELETLHKRMGHASMDRVKELVKKGMGVEKEIAAARAATAPDKVEDLLEEKESEGVGYEGDEELEDVEWADSVDWVWEKAPTREAGENKGVEIAGEQPSNEVAEGGNDEAAGEEGDEDSAAEGDSDPWKLLDSEDSNGKMREIEDLLKEGAIIIGREVKSGEENEKALEGFNGDEAESPAEELGKGKRDPFATATALTVTVSSSIASISAADWDACVLDAAGGAEKHNPFVSHAFLQCLEESRSACRDEGWLPQHLVTRDDEERVAGEAWLPQQQQEQQLVMVRGGAEKHNSFVSHAFLQCLEESRSACREEG
ncbi:unnamed protein product [Closterium sp. NIES-64]|nr:unnamed protein product [Closterium sp. NIES-64]